MCYKRRVVYKRKWDNIFKNFKLATTVVHTDSRWLLFNFGLLQVSVYIQYFNIMYTCCNLRVDSTFNQNSNFNPKSLILTSNQDLILILTLIL